MADGAGPSGPSSQWANVSLGAFLGVLGAVGVALGLNTDTTVVCVVGAALGVFGGIFVLYGVIAAGVRDGLRLAAGEDNEPGVRRFSARGDVSP